MFVDRKRIVDSTYSLTTMNDVQRYTNESEYIQYLRMRFNIVAGSRRFDINRNGFLMPGQSFVFSGASTFSYRISNDPVVDFYGLRVTYSINGENLSVERNTSPDGFGINDSSCQISIINQDIQIVRS